MGLENSQTSLETERKRDMTKVWEGWERRNRPIWKKREEDAMRARANGFLEPLSKILTPLQKNVLGITFPEGGGRRTWVQIKKGAEDMLPLIKNKQRYSNIIAAGIRRIRKRMEDKPLTIGISSDPKETKGQLPTDSYLKKSEAIKTKKRMGPPLKTVDKDAGFRLKIFQGWNANMLARYYNLSPRTIERIAGDNNLKLTKTSRGRPKKNQQSVV